MSHQLDAQGEAHEALGTAVASYGQRVLSDPHTLGNLVADLLPDLPRERSLLVTAAEAGVAAEMRQHVEEQHIDPDTAAQLVARSLSERRAIDPAASMWVASEYAQALGYQVRPYTSAVPPRQPQQLDLAAPTTTALPSGAGAPVTVPPGAGAPATVPPGAGGARHPGAEPAVLAPGRVGAAATAGPVLAAVAAAADLGPGRTRVSVLAACRSAAAILAARRAAAWAVLAAAAAVFRWSQELVVRPETRADRGRHRGRADRRIPDRRHGRAHVPVHQVPPGRGLVPGPLARSHAEADAPRDADPDGSQAGGRGGTPRPAAAGGHRRPHDAVPNRPPALQLGHARPRRGPGLHRSRPAQGQALRVTRWTARPTTRPPGQSYSKVVGFTEASPGQDCPPAKGGVGTFPTDSKMFPHRPGQVLWCEMVDVGNGPQPVYTWTLPSEDAFFVAAGAPKSSFAALDKWWSNNSLPMTAPSPSAS